MKIAASIFKTFFLSLCIIANTHFAFAQTASILPQGKTQFLDNNGKPLTSGTVDFYIPGGTTRKTTWQNSGETIANTNPVVLDAGGRAIIYGDGSYRMVVKDRLQNLIYDQLTSSSGSGGGGGSTATGDGDLVGTIKPWAGMTAPNQYMFTYGQEVSRTTYATLLTAITSTQSVFCTSANPVISGLSDTTNFWIGMSVELSCVAAGYTTITAKTSSTVTLAATPNVTTNTNAKFFPWGNGNHSNTFNLPDFRGVIPAGNNNMGGVASSNLTTTYFGATNPNSSGALGGSQNASFTLLTGNLPPYTPSGTNASSSITTANNVVTGTIAAPGTVQSGGGTGAATGTGFASGAVGGTASSQAFTGTAQGGTSTPIVFSLVQPTKTANFIIKVTPDTNSATASGVTSLGGMTGDIACGTNVTCTGNVISVALSSTFINSLWLDTTTVVADPSKFWNPTYFGNPGTGLASKFNRLQVGVEALSGSQIPESPTSWVKTLFSQDVMAASTIATTSALGQLGITGAARTSDYRTWLSSASGGSQGITGISYNNDTGTGTPIGCGVCAIAVHGAGVTGITLNQFDTGNMGAVVDVTPHSGVLGGSMYALGLTPGAYTSTSLANVSAAMYIGSGANSTKFRKGIVSFFDSLDTSVGSGGGGMFAQLYSGQSIDWFNSSDLRQTSIWGGSNGLNVASAVNSGVAGVINGSIRVANTTGGTLTENYTGSASNPVISWGTATGTPAVTASAPLSITSATGNITCASCLANPSPSLTTPSLGVATATSINGFIPDLTAWTTYTPTITCASGGPPTVTGVTGAYKKQNGKTAVAKVNFTITALNACAGSSITASGPPSPSDPLASTQVGNGYDGSLGAVVPTLIQTTGFVFVTTPATHNYTATGIYETN